jgi:hypothetical protein
MDNWMIFVIIIGAIVVGYFAYTKYVKKDSSDTTDPGPAGSVSDTITIGTDGVTRSAGSTTETYLEMPLTTYCSQSTGNPTWCNLTPTTEVLYVYDPEGGGMSETGQAITTFDTHTGLCSDGTRDCIYSEVYDSERMLIDIVNEKGERMIDKFIDDVWSDKLQIPSNQVETFKKVVKFEDDKLYFVMDDDGSSRVPVVPGNITEPITDDNKMEMPPGAIMLWVSFYYKFNNKAKPKFNFNLKSEKPVGEVLLAKIAADASQQS